MDWKRCGALAVSAAAVVAVVAFFGCGPKLPPGKPLVFECDSTKETFTIERKELDNADTYKKYFGHYGEAVECKLDGKMDAYQVYYCPVDKQYYRYKAGDQNAEFLTCPNGHKIPREE